MAKILRYEEIKKNQQVEYSEAYEIRFWIQDGEIWKPENQMYFGKRKGEHEYVVKRWKLDNKDKNIKLISVIYQ